jgi:hypothetical protein
VFYLYRQARRRAAMRAATRGTAAGAWESAAADAGKRLADRAASAAPPTPQQQHILDLRAEINRLAASHNLAEAASRYRTLLDQAPDSVFHEQRQLELANQLYLQQDHKHAAAAYELLLDRYPAISEQQGRRAAFVVDEYGDVQGLITTEDILREIVGEFDRVAKPADVGVIQTLDDSFIIDGGANVRQLNRLMNWTLPTDGPKTLNGLIVEELETIPEPGTRVTVASYPIEILETAEHAIRRVRIFRRGTAIPEELPAAVAGR